MTPELSSAETAEVLEVLARANRPRPTERAKFVRALTESLNPACQDEFFGSREEMIEYLMAQPDIVIETR